MKTPFLFLFFLTAPLLQPTLACLATVMCRDTASAPAQTADACKSTPPPSAKSAPATKTRHLPPAVLRA